MGRERKRRRWRSARRNFALGRGRRLPPFAEQQYCPRGFSSRWRATIDAREWNAQLWAKRGPGDRNRQRAKKQGPQTQRFWHWTRPEDFRAPRWSKSFRSEEHTSELQSHSDLVCRLLLEKKNNKERNRIHLPIETQQQAHH